ncbi:MAG TPA: PEP-CTERM sorting domain-containing protein [Verrucomicrobiae bacterium]|jgi:hypothetical protein|nr:PEP-CTERM sorting domain-containing protein [Verrucomicrobiae bacterium]
MKYLVTTGILLGSVLGAFAQGQFDFSNDGHTTVDAGGNPTPDVSHIYAPQAGSPGTRVTGNVATAYSSANHTGDVPTGSASYTGALIGGANGTSAATTAAGDVTFGNYWSAQVAASAGDGSITLGSSAAAKALYDSSALIAGSTTTFKTSKGNGTTGNGGFINGAAVTVPGSAGGSSVTAVVFAWYNGGGQYSTYDAAVAAGVPAGYSDPFNIDGLGSGSVTPPELSNLRSFSLTTGSVPEPSTIALGVMGASAFLLRRRMSK